MPFRRRAKQALRKVVPCIGPSSSISPLLAPLPPNAQPNDQQEPSGRQGTPQQQPPITPTNTGPPEAAQPLASGAKSARSTNVWYTALKATVDLVVQVSDVFPPLKSAAAGVQALLNVYEAFSDNQKEFEKLASRIKFLGDILKNRKSLPAGIEDRREGLKRAVEDLGKELEEKTSQSNFERLVSANESKQEILRLVREINFAIEFAMLDVTVTTEGLTLRAVEGIDWLKDYVVKDSQKTQKDLSTIAEGVIKLNTSDQLKKLGSVKGYGLSPDAPQCVAGSRVALIARLLTWAEDPSSDHAFWLSGMAGTGKTAVSRTLCHQLKSRNLLGASFFCSIKVQELSDVRNIIPALAKTLAERYPEFGDALAGILQSNPKLLVDEMKLSEQYDYLIVQPAEASFHDLDKNIILCTDALDECRDPAALKEFLNTVLSKKPGDRLRFFFTSRPEFAIRQAVESSRHSSHRQFLRLHDIEKDVVRSDIKLYVNHELSQIQEVVDEYAGCWPPPEVHHITERADALFIVAATIIRRISGDGRGGNPVRRLKSFGGSDASTGIQQLYQDILQEATSTLEDSELDDLRSCLSLLVAAQRPLSMAEYAALLGWEVSDVSVSFSSLHSVVEMPSNKDDDRPISIYHASFVDFLTNYATMDMTMDIGEARPPWAVDKREAHSMAFEWCLTLMASEDVKKGLYLGVSGARTSYRSIEDLPRLRSDLAYACTMWGNHALDGKPLSDHLQKRMKTFLEAKGLYWLEALSAERSVGYSNILWDLSKVASVDGLAKLLVDIRDFAQMFATLISQFPPHLYLSAIPFHQATSPKPAPWIPDIPSIPIVHTSQESRTKHGRRLVHLRAEVKCIDVAPDGSRLVVGSGSEISIFNTQSGELVVGPMKGHSNLVFSVAFSPSGARIVSGSRDETIRVWDAQSGELVLGPIKGHSSYVASVEFSPDGATIVSGSWDKSIRVWDAQSGEMVMRTRDGHCSHQVLSVAFSPDGATIISGSYDGAIQLWDARSGELMVGPIKGHTDRISSVAFSPDGTRIVSGSLDKTICIWDARSGRLVVGPMEGHSEEVNSVVFSPDGSKVVSGSDDNTIRVWDTQNGQLVVGQPTEGHLGHITSLAFSPDGGKIYSGSWDYTIWVWDACIWSDKLPVDSVEGHSASVASVAFSPDGTRIVSGSDDKTIQIWDAQSGVRVVGPMVGHSEIVTSVAFSPDGTTIASGSYDETIRIWDARNGELLVGPMEGHSHAVNSVAFSPDGTRIISGSFDKTVQVWNVQNGKLMMGPMNGYTAMSVAFSPDGTHIASGSGDNTIRVWDARTGELVVGPIEGHSDLVTSVTFSPSGEKIVSGSWDKTIRVWDARSGQLVVGPIVGHSGWVVSVAFSPDGARIVSGSIDRTVCVWDARSGELVAGPIKGHSGAVNSTAFSPDGTKVVSGSSDKTIRVWDARSVDPVVGSPERHSDIVTAVLSPDQTRISPGSQDKTTLVQHSPSAQKVHNTVNLDNYPLGSFSMDADGWIRNLSNDLLLWVPPQFRDIYLLPLQLRIPAATWIELSYALYHGRDWQKCNTPRQSKPLSCLPWPISTSSASE